MDGSEEIKMDAAGNSRDDGGTDTGPVRGEVYSVDARGAMGVQAGDGNTQINEITHITYSHTEEPGPDGDALPVTKVSGKIKSPYRGLHAFREKDAPFFFGRAKAASEILERMSQLAQGQGILMVEGASGVGKSSLLQAGVLPRLRGNGLASAPGAALWPWVMLAPGRKPLDQLALKVALLTGTDARTVRQGLEEDPAGFALAARQAALARSPGPDAEADSPVADGQGEPRLLLVVDQFEQVFTQCEDEKERQAFITALHAAAHGRDGTPSALVVLGMRSDFDGRCADYPELADAAQSRYLLMPMNEAELLSAITEPARMVGSQVHAELGNQLLDEVRARQPGGAGAGVLPLLSHALDQAWRARPARNLPLTLDDYVRTGGIKDAVARSAGSAYDRLTSSQQEAARRIFTRLVTSSPEGGDTADRSTRAELAQGQGPAEAADVDAVLEAFAAERLLTLDDGSVEISHEALLTSWPLLHDWLAETHDARIVRTRLRSITTEWEKGSRDPSYLYRGTLLQAATETAEKADSDPARNPPLNRGERDFLHASQRASRRSARRRQAAIVVLSVLVLVAGGLAAWANQQRTEANQQSDATRAGLLSVKSEITGDSDPALAKLMSIAAWRLSPSEQARYAMMNAAALPGVTNLPGSTAQFSPDGKILAVGSDNSTLQLWDVATMQPMGAPITGAQQFLFNPAGKTIAIESPSGAVRLWNIGNRRWIGTPFAHSSRLAAFSPNGSLLAVYTDSGQYLQLWNPNSGTIISHPIEGEAPGVAFSPNGKLLAVESYADATSILTFWNTTTWKQLAGKPISPCRIPAPLAIAFSPDSNVLATGCGNTGNTALLGDGPVTFFDVATRKQIGSAITSVDAPVGGVSFSPDGKTLAFTTLASNAVGKPGGGTFLFSVATHQQVGQPLPGGGPVFGVTFSPDGRFLASEKASGQIQLWDVAAATGRPEGAPLAVTGGVGGTAFSPDGKILAVGTGTRDSADAVRLYNTAGADAPYENVCGQR